MADGHGGYRKPANPAPVSGPGKYSKRTDGGPAQVMSTVPGQPYGQATADMAAQRVQPMAGQAPMPKPAQVQQGQGQQAQQPMQMPAYTGGGFGDPSQRPDEPVTTGVDVGAGPGSEALSYAAQQAGPRPDGTITQMIGQIAATGDATGTLAKLLLMARQRGV